MAIRAEPTKFHTVKGKRDNNKVLKSLKYRKGAAKGEFEVVQLIEE